MQFNKLSAIQLLILLEAVQAQDEDMKAEAKDSHGPAVKAFVEEYNEAQISLQNSIKRALLEKLNFSQSWIDKYMLENFQSVDTVSEEYLAMNMAFHKAKDEAFPAFCDQEQGGVLIFH